MTNERWLECSEEQGTSLLPLFFLFGQLDPSINPSGQPSLVNLERTFDKTLYLSAISGSSKPITRQRLARHLQFSRFLVANSNSSNLVSIIEEFTTNVPKCFHRCLGVLHLQCLTLLWSCPSRQHSPEGASRDQFDFPMFCCGWCVWWCQTRILNISSLGLG